MKSLLFSLLLISPFLVFSQNYDDPESVEGDTLTGEYYIGNIGTHNILRRLSDGTLEIFAEGFANGPAGIELVDGVLYACTGGEVRGFSIDDGSQVFSVQTGGTFLNGITHDDAGFLYITDFSTQRIHKIDIAMQSSEIFVPATGSTPNGIIYDGTNDRFIFVTWGANAQIIEVSPADGTLNTLFTTNLTNIDGVALDGDGNIYVSSWGANAVHRYEPTFTEAPELIVSGLNRPADIYYNLQTDTLAIPNTGSSTVTFVGLGEDPPSAVEDGLVDLKINLYPNPAVDYITATSKMDGFILKSRFDIFSENGRKMDVPVMKSSDSAVLDLSHIPAGTYVLTCIINGNYYSKSFIRQ